MVCVFFFFFTTNNTRFSWITLYTRQLVVNTLAKISPMWKYTVCKAKIPFCIHQGAMLIYVFLSKPPCRWHLGFQCLHGQRMYGCFYDSSLTCKSAETTSAAPSTPDGERFVGQGSRHHAQLVSQHGEAFHHPFLTRVTRECCNSQRTPV